MNQNVSEIRSEQWRKIVNECINRDPQISKRQWCEDNGIRFRSLMYWQHKFQLEALEQMEGNIRADLPACTAQEPAHAFVDLTPKYEAIQAEPQIHTPQTEAFSSTPELMILAGAYKICVNGSVQTATLEKVLRAISHA